MTTTTSHSCFQPPHARREEDRVVYAGAVPDSKYPRQLSDSQQELLDPPVAVPDPYGWMRDDDKSRLEVLDHLRAENEYTEAVTQHLSGFRERLYQEMISYQQETDYTTPRPRGSYYYYTRTYQGKSYSVHCRARKNDSNNGDLRTLWDGSADSPVLKEEETILDVNALAEKKDYCGMGSVKPAPSNKLLAYAADFSGSETYLMFVKDIESNEIVDHDEQLVTSGSIVWGKDDSTLYYSTLNEVLRPYRLYRRKLDQKNEPDELLFEEPSDLYFLHMYKSLDGRYLFLDASSADSTEIHFLDLHDTSQPKLHCVAKRRPKVLYEVDHRNGQFWIQSNVGGLTNMALFVAPAKADNQDEWELVKDENGHVLFDGGNDRSLNSITCFKDHVVASGREGGLPRVYVLSLTPKEDQQATNLVSKCEMLTFEEESHDVGVGAHYEFDTDKVVVIYNSMVTPPQSIEIDLNDVTKRTILKEKIVPGYDKSLYSSERRYVKSRDGTVDIPVSMVFRKDAMDKHMATGNPLPTYLYGYGSYGITMEADFSTNYLIFLNRGMACVTAHIRGGSEMGRQWYEEPNGAKYLCKKNTFNDFVDVARWLVTERKLTVPDLLACHGGSAGGLLIGASINQAPELFKMAILDVPFVDVLCTMIDASIPLTTHEWEEWGNPNEKKYFQYMSEYSPMQTVQRGKKYPTCFLSCGLNDPRVPYWEAIKLAATLRHEADPETSGPVCVRVEMMAGHSSASDRYKKWKEAAFKYAFLLDQLGLADKDESEVQKTE